MPQVLSFGRNAADEAPDCVLLCPHDDAGDEFMSDHPEIEDSLTAGERTFTDYRYLERDSGSYELAVAMAEIITNMSDRRFEVHVVKSNLPRSIVDVNRVTRCAVRRVFDHEENPELLKELRDLHFREVSKIRKALHKLHEKDGVFVDIHTMAPYSPAVVTNDVTMPADEYPDRLHEYIKSFLDAPMNGERRFVDVISGRRDEQIGDSVLRSRVLERLRSFDIRYRENDPFPAANHITAAGYMIEGRGLSVDVPKDYLSDSTVSGGGFNLIYPEINGDKVVEIATPIALAVLDTLRAR